MYFYIYLPVLTFFNQTKKTDYEKRTPQGFVLFVFC